MIHTSSIEEFHSIVYLNIVDDRCRDSNYGDIIYLNSNNFQIFKFPLQFQHF